jgi:parvulin-like peptidyl-prolyl isomerase
MSRAPFPRRPQVRTHSAVVTGAALIALAGLAFAAGSPPPGTPPAKAGAATDKAPAPSPNDVLVRLGKETITRGDVQARLDDMPEQLRANYLTAEGRQQLLDRMIEERVWLMAALKSGVADRPKVKAQLDQQRRDLLIRTWVTEVMAGNPAPTDSESRAWYDAHLSDYKVPATITVRHIQTATEAQGRRVRALLKAGGDFVKLAKSYSTDSLTRLNGGMLGAVSHDGQFSVIGRQPALADSAFALAAGKVGGPWKGEPVASAVPKPGTPAKTEAAWHVIKVDEMHPETTRPFEQVRPMIARQLTSERSRAFYNVRLDSLRKALGVKPDSAAIKRFVSQKKEPKEMFKEAQDKGPPAERIAAYKALLAEYPDSDVAPQAQFMIGFIQSEELKDYDQADASFRQLLARYPKSELAASAKWMVDHMRSEDAPAFAADSAAARGAKAPPALARPGMAAGGAAADSAWRARRKAMTHTPADSLHGVAGASTPK